MKNDIPAFPIFGQTRDGKLYNFLNGMSLRDYFAGQALASVIQAEPTIKEASEILGIPQAEYNYIKHYPMLIAKNCYSIAEEMLKAREA